MNSKEPSITRAIEPLQPSDIAELSRFLAIGFGASAEVGPLSPGVLLWKYFDPCGHDDSPRSFVAREGAAIIGHVGLCPTSFDGGTVATFHMIDWLGSVGYRGVGSSLMRHIHEMMPTQYAVGTTSAARRSFDAAGYVRLDDVPVFRKILRPGYRLRASEGSFAKAVVGAARDTVRIASRREPTLKRKIDLRRVTAFGDEVETVCRSADSSASFTGRGSGRLNHLLRHPFGCLEGYLILEGDRIRGFALLNLLQNGRSRIGRIVECFLDQTSIDVWGAAIAALGASLGGRGADALVACGSTPWSAEALRDRGFAEVFRLECRLRDPSGLVPRDRPIPLDVPGGRLFLSPISGSSWPAASATSAS